MSDEPDPEPDAGGVGGVGSDDPDDELDDVPPLQAARASTNRRRDMRAAYPPG